MQSVKNLLFFNRGSIALISIVLLGLISFLPPYGVIAGWIYLLLALLICARQGSFAEIGFRRPGCWRRTIALGIGIGVFSQMAFAIVIDPLLGRLTGVPVDLSSLDGMRGDLLHYIVMLAIGWIMGGFLEEMLFRGYLLKRIQYLFGEHGWSKMLAILLTSVAFGMAHGYQDIAGMISTGLMGALLGGLFVWTKGNLWLPILVHGISNTIGITLIYTSADRFLGQILFS
jgi:membrane protease YdiL (CAAX protease family)